LCPSFRQQISIYYIQIFIWQLGSKVREHSVCEEKILYHPLKDATDMLYLHHVGAPTSSKKTSAATSGKLFTPVKVREFDEGLLQAEIAKPVPVRVFGT